MRPRARGYRFAGGLIIALATARLFAGGTQSLDGGWELMPAALTPGDVYRPESPQQAVRDWLPAPVPGHWYQTGRDFNGAVWYRKHFTPTEAPPGARWSLRFGGVDYAADVWLNGRYLGYHRGYFEPFSLDPGAAMLPGDNLLVVRVDSPDEFPGREWSLRKRLIKGILDHHDTRPGGAWSPRGQEGNSGGIWQGVSLRWGRGVLIGRRGWTVDLPDAPVNGESARLHVQAELSGNLPPDGAQVRLTVAPDGFSGPAPVVTNFPLSVDAAAAGKITADIDVPAVHRWWPAGEGPQDRYRLTLSLVDRQGAVLDAVDEPLAFRTVRFDEDGHAFHINGRRLFLRGTNYISSPWPGSLGREDYRRDLGLMLQANINAVRVHAHVEGEAFYEEADRAGMLVWQDFPLQWGYDDSPAFATEAARQASALVDRLGSHPSIFAWCSHNEPPWNAPWMKYKYPDYDPDQNRVLTAQVTQALAQDRSRYIHPYSATGEHLWMGWYSGKWSDHQKRATVSIVSEFGAQALPDEDVLRELIPATDLWPASTDPKDPAWASWDYRNFQVNETFRIAGVDRGDSPAEFVRNSQQYQAKLVGFAAESYRRQRYQPVAAAFHFLFSETWPSINWGVMDYRRRPKPGYAALARAFQPVLPSIEWDPEAMRPGADGRVVLWALNDTRQDFGPVRLAWKVSRNGAALKKGVFETVLGADSGAPVGQVRLPSLAPGAYQVDAVLEGARKRVLSSNLVEFTVPEPKP